jgi:sortase B
MKNFKIIIKSMVVIGAFITFMFNTTSMVSKAADLKSDASLVNELKEVNEFDVLKSINEDYKFWLNIENTQIDYPIVQSNDNEFYLNNDFKKEESKSGVPFVDFRNNALEDKNTILYGHNMKNGSMFASLKNFKDEEFFNANNKITIVTKEEVLTYEVFSVYVTENTTSYLKVNFEDNEFESYLNNSIAKSMFKSNVSVNKEDKIITLSTCDYTFEDARLVVQAKLVK